jgi:hypothetical protein
MTLWFWFAFTTSAMVLPIPPVPPAIATVTIFDRGLQRIRTRVVLNLRVCRNDARVWIVLLPRCVSPLVDIYTFLHGGRRLGRTGRLQSNNMHITKYKEIFVIRGDLCHYLADFIVQNRRQTESVVEPKGWRVGRCRGRCPTMVLSCARIDRNGNSRASISRIGDPC